MVSKEQREYYEEQKHISLYKSFMNDNPELVAGKERRLEFLKAMKIPKNSHIHNFFMDTKLNVDDWFSQKPNESKENPKNSDNKTEFKPLRRRK